MSLPTRRSFLKQTLAAAATITIAGTKSSGKVLGANDTIRIGVAGLNGRGKSHVEEFGRMKDVQITYLIDPDTRTFANRIKEVEKYGAPTPKTVQDVRKALEDKNLDALSIATPNHWHSLMTIWACQAGKDVYVEKPCSHNVHEGRIAVETARKYERIVQHGTQSRSGSNWMKLAALAESGKLGKLLVSRALCYKLRPSIGVKQPSVAPAEVDFNLWLGPAPEQQFHTNLVHYNWHWFWDFGNGDIGNQGVHEMDKARWMIPGATYPKSVFSLGGRFGYSDQGETANTQLAFFDYGGTQLIFEVRGLPSKGYRGSKGVDNILHFEEGIVIDDKFYPKGKKEAQTLPTVESKVAKRPGGGHFGNFIAAVRSRRPGDLNADILEGHISCALIHYANASYRLGEEVPFQAGSKSFGDNKDAYESLARMEEHLAKENHVSLDGLKYRLGRKLVIDAQSERAVHDEDANKLLTRQYRKGFEVPAKV